MKMKVLTLFMCTLIALSALGIAYAQWNDIITIHNTMTFGTNTLRFVDPKVCWDNEATKDVGAISCSYTDYHSGGYNRTLIAMENAYPGYEGYCNVTIQNTGTLPNSIIDVSPTPGIGLTVGQPYNDASGNPIGWRLDDATTNKPVLNIYVQNATDLSIKTNTLDPTKTLLCKITVQVADGAEECQTYTFQIAITYEEAP